MVDAHHTLGEGLGRGPIQMAAIDAGARSARLSARTRADTPCRRRVRNLSLPVAAAVLVAVPVAIIATNPHGTNSPPVGGTSGPGPTATPSTVRSGVIVLNPVPSRSARPYRSTTPTRAKSPPSSATAPARNPTRSVEIFAVSGSVVGTVVLTTGFGSITAIDAIGGGGDQFQVTLTANGSRQTWTYRYSPQSGTWTRVS
jgi:hypothetical protein